MPARSRIGITLTAVAAILGSALLILAAAALLAVWYSPVALPGTPLDAQRFMKVALLVMFCILLALSLWGIATAVGLFRLRPWSRISALVFSSLLLFLCGSGAVMMAITPMPLAPAASRGIVPMIKTGIVGLYAALACLGAFWLYYFNKPPVREQFVAGGAITESGNRPLSITIIAVLLLFSGLTSAIFVFIAFPTFVFGLIVKGLAARGIFLFTAIASIWLGIGLLRLNPISRVLAIAFLGYYILSTVCYFALPGYAERQRAILELMPFGLQNPNYTSTQPGPMMIFAALPMYLAQLWFLIARRSAFREPQPAKLSRTSF